ncbi:MAG: MBOAT family O-acyltransferase [Bacteroidia bacterium]
MVFSSILFLFYFLPVFLITYFIADKKFKNIIILIGSIIFYSWGAPRFIFVILGTTFVDFHLVKLMSVIQTRWQRRLLLTISVFINLGLLVYFKYSNFFIENINGVLSYLFHIKGITWTKLVLPLGISFYTFETITYVVDVYRGVHKPLTKFRDYQLYIILFPKLIAGPIIRYHEIADQITDRSQNDTADNKLIGFYRFILGLSKKVLIANQMGIVADSVFGSDYHTLDSLTGWIGILAYTFQIYFDFSGYSDMAIGLGKMMGFKFPENFNNPYISQSITEFWRRWHITLGNWMKNYLYIPLGGNRVKSKLRLYFNLWIVFLASGLWHGASWSFVFWGAYHGFFLVIEKIFMLKVYRKMGKFLSTLVTFLIAVVGWVFFRVEKLSDAFIYLKRMFSFDFKGSHLNASDSEFYTFFIIAVLFAFFAYFKRGQKVQDAVYFGEYNNTRHSILTGTSIILLVLSISFIASNGFNPFIYFRF